MNTSILPYLEIKDLIVKKGNTIILEISSLKLYQGEILAIIGPNGAGKTTLINSLSLLEKPIKGEIFFKGERINSKKNRFDFRRRIGVVFQDPLLFNTTVYNNVASGLKFRGIGSKEIKKRVYEVLEYLRISHLANRSAKKLSGGEACRVSLARAFVLKPEILFLDEPFSSLDPPTRETLLSDLEWIIHKTQTTTIFSTHDCSEAIRLANRIAVMNKGRILQIGLTEEVINFPKDEFIANFVGAETILPCRVIKKKEEGFIATISGQEIEATGEANLNEEVILCIRPENVILSIDPLDKKTLSARNIFQGVIKKIIPLGYYFKVSLDCGFPLVTYITKYSMESLALKEGKRITAHFKATAVHVIRKRKTN